MPVMRKRAGPDPFAAVYAAPDDDAPREEVARALEERGDPRGAFIRLQLARARGEKLSKADSALERSVLKAGAKAWLAPLGDALVASDVKWERGFPVAGRLNFMGKWASLKGRESPPHPLAAVPALATLRRLKLSSPNMLLSTDELDLIMSLPALRHLREVESLPRALLVKIARSAAPFALERIDILGAGGGGHEGEAGEHKERAVVVAALEDGRGLPKLTDLELSWSYAGKPDDYAWLWTSDLGRRLRTLRVAAYYLGRVLPAWKRALDERAKEIALEEIELHHGMFTVSLHRAGGGFRSLRGKLKDDRYGAGKREIEEALAALGAGAFDEVDIQGFAPGAAGLT